MWCQEGLSDGQFNCNKLNPACSKLVPSFWAIPIEIRDILVFNGTFCRELVSYGFLGCVRCNINTRFPLVCLLVGGSVWSWMKSHLYFGSLRAKLILAPLDCMPKWIRPSMNRYGIFFVQTSTLPHPSMRCKHAKHGRCCMQDHELPTRSHVEFEDTSVVLVR